MLGGADWYWGNRNAVPLIGSAGDAFLVHPLLLHTPSASARAEPRAILNLPFPMRQRRHGERGSLSALDAPIRDAIRDASSLSPCLFAPLVAWTIAWGRLHGRCRCSPVLAWLTYWPVALGFAVLCVLAGDGGAAPRSVAPGAPWLPRAWLRRCRRVREATPAPDPEAGGDGDDQKPLLRR